MQTEVLTIQEVANYLRLPEDVVLAEASHGHLPGRKVADTWRFLKTAIDDWLRMQDSRAILLSQFGVFSDDDQIEQVLMDIYSSAGRVRGDDEKGV